ncbi:hypothetical protein Aduo_019953 [Ancylostoma duodenale]
MHIMLRYAINTDWLFEMSLERHNIFLDMDLYPDAPGVSDSEKTKAELPEESAPGNDELDIAGVSTHDIDDLEKDVIQNILGENVDSARGFDLFTRPDSPHKCHCSPSTSSSGESSACSRDSDNEYIPADGDNETMSEGSFSEPADVDDDSEGVSSHARRQKIPKPKRTHRSYVDDSSDNDFEERLRTAVSSDVGDNIEYKELTDSLKISRQVWDRLYK